MWTLHIASPARPYRQHGIKGLAWLPPTFASVFLTWPPTGHPEPAVDVGTCQLFSILLWCIRAPKNRNWVSITRGSMSGLGRQSLWVGGLGDNCPLGLRPQVLFKRVACLQPSWPPGPMPPPSLHVRPKLLRGGGAAGWGSHGLWVPACSPSSHSPCRSPLRFPLCVWLRHSWLVYENWQDHGLRSHGQGPWKIISHREESICCNPLVRGGRARAPSRPCVSHDGLLGPPTEAVLGQVFGTRKNGIALDYSSDFCSQMLRGHTERTRYNRRQGEGKGDQGGEWSLLEGEVLWLNEEARPLFWWREPLSQTKLALISIQESCLWNLNTVASLRTLLYIDKAWVTSFWGHL